MAFVDSFFGTIDTLIFILKWFWWLILLIIIFIQKATWKNWVIDCVIIEKRENNLIKTNDRARKIIDADGLVKYQMKKSKDTMPVLNFDWILHNNNAHTNFLERYVNLLRPTIGTVFLFRYGSKQYKPIRIKEKEGLKTKWEELKDGNGNSMMINIYEQLDPRDKLKQLNFEVVDWDNMNFMVQEHRSTMDRRKSNRDKWLQVLLPLGAIALAALVVIFMMYYGYKYATDLRLSAGGQNSPPQSNQAEDLVNDIIPGK